LDSDSADFFRLILEDDMAPFTRSQRLLVSAGVAGLGSAALVTLLAANIATLADAGATAVETSPPFAGPDAPVCGTPAATGVPNLMFRLAQTEVPRAEMSAASAAPAFAETEPPLWTGLGAITYKITTANERAQTYFDQGLRLAYAFNHGEAQRAFRMAQKLDPDCAMCFWGEALVLGPNINLPMPEDAAAPAYAAAQKAKALAGKASPREQALISALVTRYGGDPKAARAPFDKAYAAEMAKVATQFPDDDEIATLYAEAVMDLSPGTTGNPVAANPTRRARPSCRHWSACWLAIPIIPAPFTITFMPWRPRTGPSAPSPMPTGCAAKFPAPAISCTCRAISTIGSAAISTRWKTTRRR
jgi:hypothetical protein